MTDPKSSEKGGNRVEIDRFAELNKEMDLLLYAISHDLRAPLRSIDGFGTALEEDYGDVLDDMGKDFLGRVRNASKKLESYIEGVLMVSRESRGDMVPEEMDLSALVEKVAEETASRFPEQSVKWSVEPGLSVVADARLIRILLEKLFDNAWKFTSKTSNAEVVFSSGEDPEHGRCFCIRDNGAGFDMEYAPEKLFGLFQRMHEEEEFPGLGTGLATVKRIINRHGGAVWALSEPGKGASICFVLPDEVQ